MPLKRCSARKWTATLKDCWHIPATIDSKALERAGVDLGVIPAGEFNAAGVCRRSALRLMLARAALGYAVVANGIVITTKDCADTYGIANSARPTIEGLHHGDREARRDTVFAAGYWRLESRIWIPHLIDLLTDADRDVQFNSAYAIAAFGSEAIDAVEGLNLLLVSDDSSMREVAKFALSRIGPAAVNRLTTEIENPEIKIARVAAGALGDMGITGRLAMADLIDIATRHLATDQLTHENDYCERCDLIAMAISRVGIGGNFDWLTRLMKSPNPGERALAAKICGELGASGVVFVPALQAMLSDQAVTVRRKAAWAMAQLDLPADTESSFLEAAERDSDRHVTLWAAVALRKLRATQNNE